ncbi:MAG TPA: hypothetical protein VNJ12_05085 [Candidatus Dormibacteraeota bacterium]|nr:hypothetical protein [Candidatus Dormibacteraeota bacterium]
MTLAFLWLRFEAIEEFERGEVAEGLARTCGVVDVSPAAKLRIEIGDVPVVGNHLVESLAVRAMRALALRHRRSRGEIGEAGLAVARGQMEARLDRALGRRSHSAANERFANHLHREWEATFPFLGCPGLEATNWHA